MVTDSYMSTDACLYDVWNAKKSLSPSHKSDRRGRLTPVPHTTGHAGPHPAVQLDCRFCRALSRRYTRPLIHEYMIDRWGPILWYIIGPICL